MTPFKLQMSVTLALWNSIQNLLFGSSNGDSTPSGAEAVRSAVNEMEDITDRDFTVTLGEPDIVEDYGRFVNDPKVVIPILDSPFGAGKQLVFDIPEGREDEFSSFIELLDLFGIDFEMMEELAGVEVPVSFIGGNINVDWDTIKSEADKAGDSDEQSAEEVADEVVEEAIESEEQSDEPGVKVEETTISGEGSDE